MPTYLHRTAGSTAGTNTAGTHTAGNAAGTNTAGDGGSGQGGGGGGELQCSICLCEVLDGEEVKMLPCLHRYHPG